MLARAADAMRTGSIVRIHDSPGGGIAAAAVETATRCALAHFESPSAGAFLVLTQARARTLKMPFYTQDVVALPITAPLDAGRLRAIADPTADLAEPLKGPFQTARELPSGACLAAIRLAKLTGLLPAVLAGSADTGDSSVAIPAATIKGYDNLVVRALRLVTRARTARERRECRIGSVPRGRRRTRALRCPAWQSGHGSACSDTATFGVLYRRSASILALRLRRAAAWGNPRDLKRGRWRAALSGTGRTRHRSHK